MILLTACPRQRSWSVHQRNAVVLSSTIFVVVSCAPLEGQALLTTITAPKTSLQGPLPFNDLQTNGINGLLQQQAVKDHPKNILPIDEILPLGPFRLLFSVNASAIYNDNIYIQHSHKTADYILTLNPEIILATGSYNDASEFWMALDYHPTFSHFVRNSQNDSIEQEANFNAEWRPAAWTFGGKQLYQSGTTPIEEAGKRAEHSVYYTNFYANYEYSPKTHFQVDADQLISDFDDDLLSEKKWTLDAKADYWLTPKVDVSANVTGGRVDVSGGDRQNFEEYVAQVEYDYSRKTILRGSGGLEVHQFSSGKADRYDGIFSFSCEYDASADNTYQIEFYRRPENSVIAQNQNYIVTGASISATEGLLGRCRAGIAAGYNHTDYYTTTLNATQASGYNYFYVRPSIIYQATGTLSLEVFYQFQKNWSSPVNAFENNIMGIDLGYHF